MEEIVSFVIRKVNEVVGIKGGRYIYTKVWREELIEMAKQKLGVEVEEKMLSLVEEELKTVWKRILTMNYRRKNDCI